MWELAGAVGLDPRPCTLRQLLWAYQGRARFEWSHTSALWAPLVNAIRDPKLKREPWQPDDVNPFDAQTGELKRSRDRGGMSGDDLKQLRGMFT